MVLLFHFLQLAVEVLIYLIVDSIVVVVIVNFNLQLSFGRPNSSRCHTSIPQILRYFLFALLQYFSGHTLSEWVLFRVIVFGKFFVKLV